MILILAIAVAIALLWLWMLVDAVRRPAPPRLFGSERATRWFWVVALLLFNPILAIGYLLLVPLGLLARAPVARHAAVVVLASVAIALQFVLLGPTGADWRDGDHDLSLHAASQVANTSHSTTTASRDQHEPIAARHLRVVHGDHPLLAYVGREVARQLTDLDFVEKVECWPASRRAAPGASAPDRVVEIHARELRAWPLPLVRAFTGSLWVRGAPAAGVQAMLEPLTLVRRGQTWTELELRFDSLSIGIALGGAVYGEPAEALATAIVERIVPPLREAVAAGGLVEPIDGMLTFEPVAELPELAGLQLSRRDAEVAPFVHHLTTWVLDDPRPDPVVLDELEARLVEHGWQAGNGGGFGVGDRKFARHFARGAERIVIQRWPEVDASVVGYDPVELVPGGQGPEITPPPPTPVDVDRRPFHIGYESRWTADELRAFAARVCDADAAPSTWLMLRECLDDAALRDRLAQVDPGPDPKSWSMLAKLHRAVGDEAGERRALDAAWILLHFLGGPKDLEEPLEKRFGDLDAAPPSADPAALTAFGLDEVVRGEAAVFEVERGEPLVLLLRGSDGPEGVLRVSTPGESDANTIELAFGGSSHSATVSVAADADGSTRVGFSNLSVAVSIESLGPTRERVRIRVD